MTYKCIECGKETEEMIRFEDEIHMCDWCYGNIQDGVMKIINEFKEW